MAIENFVLGFSVFSDPKSYLDSEDKQIRVFTHTDVSEILGADSTFHFNRGDFNFFSQYGAAAYAFWTHSFSLSSEEIAPLNHDHDLALALLFDKLKIFVETHEITLEKIDTLKSRFDCRCEILFITAGDGMLFDIQPENLLFMGNLDTPFAYWERPKLQINQLKKAAQK